jgi:hypothetical protein
VVGRQRKDREIRKTNCVEQRKPGGRANAYRVQMKEVQMLMLNTSFPDESNPEPISSETVSLTPAKDPTAAERKRRERAKKRADRDNRDTVTVTRDAATTDEEIVLLYEQLEIKIAFNERGNLILRQSSWPDEDAVIVVNRGNIDAFIDALTDAVGIPSVGRR